MPSSAPPRFGGGVKQGPDEVSLLVYRVGKLSCLGATVVSRHARLHLDDEKEKKEMEKEGKEEEMEEMEEGKRPPRVPCVCLGERHVVLAVYMANNVKALNVLTYTVDSLVENRQRGLCAFVCACLSTFDRLVLLQYKYIEICLSSLIYTFVSKQSF